MLGFSPCDICFQFFAILQEPDLNWPFAERLKSFLCDSLKLILQEAQFPTCAVSRKA
jgi:hypothetical protein